VSENVNNFFIFRATGDDDKEHLHHHNSDDDKEHSHHNHCRQGNTAAPTNWWKLPFSTRQLTCIRLPQDYYRVSTGNKEHSHYCITVLVQRTFTSQSLLRSYQLVKASLLNSTTHMYSSTTVVQVSARGTGSSQPCCNARTRHQASHESTQ
jgi:hypothetical protein